MTTLKVELTRDQQEDVIRAIRQLDQLAEVMDNLEACGESCQARRNLVHNTRQRLQQVLNRFTPKP